MHSSTTKISDYDHGRVMDVRDLPGAWLVDEWKPFESSEAESLPLSLHPRIVKILNGDRTEFDSLVHPKGFWRDLLSLTWTFRTFYTRDNIVSHIPQLLGRAGVEKISLPVQAEVAELINGASILRLVVHFHTSNPAATCMATCKFIRLQDDTIQLFTITTQIVELAISPWKECLNSRPLTHDLPERTDILVIGGSHAGLSMGAYFSALKCDFCIVDREEQTGDAWAKRYDSATLHSTTLASTLPYRDFPNDYPEYITAKQLAEFYRQYAADLNLPIHQSTNVDQATFDEGKQEWNVQTTRGTLIAKHLVFAIGMGGRFPTLPNWPGMTTYRGVQLHSSNYTNALEWKGKKVAIFGTGTTGMDVALDCAKLGIDVMLVQRGASRVYPPGHVGKGMQALWNGVRSVACADQTALENPVALQHPLSLLSFKKMSDEHDKRYYKGLKDAGCEGIYEGAMHNQDMVLTGRHYPDIGACSAIIDGHIKVKSDAAVEGLDETGILFSNGSHVTADVIIYCTGFKHDTRDIVADIVGEANALYLKPVWGIDNEGEIRGAYGPSGHDHIWHAGGRFLYMRYYGQFLALQLVAVLAGIRPEPVCM